VNPENKLDGPKPSPAGAEKPQETRSESRRFLRLPWASPTVVRYLNGDPATKTFVLSARVAGTLLNVSAGGALVLCENAPQPGELMTLELYLDDQVSFGGILGKVKRVEPDEEGGFLVGVEFGTLKSLALERSGWQLPPGVVRFDTAFREALHHYLFTLEVQRRSQQAEPSNPKVSDAQAGK
jgi:hypothetical protein